VKRFLNRRLLCRSFILGFSVCCLPSMAQPLAPVSSLTLTAQDQQALRDALPQDTESITTLIWQGNPLTLTLPLHQETRLLFSEPVQVDVNGQLTTEQLRIINDHQTVYLTALKAFDNTRLYMTLKNSGQIIFLDISTPKETDHPKKSAVHAIQIKLSPAWPAVHRETALRNSPPAGSFDGQNSKHPLLSTESPDYLSDSPFFSASVDDLVQTIRFAWRQLYAPSYLLSNDVDFMRAPMHTSFWISGLFTSDSVFVHPIASWMHAELFITALALRNPYPHPASLDLAHDLCGHWRAAMLYPRTNLQVSGDKRADSTTLFLVSSEPFDRVFQAGGCNHGRA